MQPGRDTYPLRDVLAYPPSVLKRDGNYVTVGAHYERIWQDGFGARGWKLNHTLNDPEIIASTRETGNSIPTSVFVHDVLDHLFSGFAPSGHRAEAMAMALQKALTQAVTDAQHSDVDEAEVRIRISANRVSLEVIHPGGRRVFTTDVGRAAIKDRD
ncbi:MAG: hypothetical protein ABR558_02765 [Thioalkalivibrio sp.]